MHLPIIRIQKYLFEVFIKLLSITITLPLKHTKLVCK